MINQVRLRAGGAFDVGLVIKQQLEELGLEQRDLAGAAEVTESYISQLLTGKKLLRNLTGQTFMTRLGGS
jgi:transcriptional regulator with XRE-family HTH domain